MKKITLTLIAISLFIVKSTKAQEEDLIASEPISSGCLPQTRGAEESALPTIKLTKEGSILSVDLLNYSSNCGTTGFEVENRMIGGNNDTPSVVISVVPVIPAPMDCICPFNISYTVRGLEKNKFYLTCWWFDGQVELTEGEPLVLEYKTKDVVIDGLKYRLLKTSHQAKLLYQIPWNNEAEIIQIPSEVEYEGENYTVTTIVEELFGSNNTIKKIIIPKTIKNTEFGSLEEIPSNPFSSCLSLETIEVEEGSPVFSSVDGVLFSTDKKTLIGYPAGSPRESYTVPDGVKTEKLAAFFNSQHLKKIVLTNDIETLGLSVFGYGKNLEEVILSSNIKELPSYIFRNCKKLNSVFIPKGVTTIASSAFEGCISLESISLPESVATVGTAAFMGCTSLKRAALSPNLKVIPLAMFADCSNLAEVMIPFGITTIGRNAFGGCKAMQSFDLPESINYIDDFAFRYLSNLKDIYCHATTVPNTTKFTFGDVDLPQVTLHVPASSVDSYQSTSPWNQFGAIVPLETEMAYRPMIEDDKVWKVGALNSGNPVQWVQYYYLDGDTIIDGKTCKQMMRQRFVSPDYAAANEISQENSLKYVGAWYEENKKVYFYSATNKQMKMLYDFSLEDNGTFQMDGLTYVVGPRQTGGIEGFKGVYRDIKQVDGESIYRCAPWLEGVGVIYGSPRGNVFNVELAEPMWNLMACYVGDEVIYLNDALEDGATPEGAEARNRFDFTHTIKNQPHSPMRGAAEPSIYGEYSELQLSIHLDPLDDAYLVRITNESGKAVYEKNINAGNIMGLNIDISSYARGRYTVTVENSRESFTGMFEAQMTGIGLTPTLTQGKGVIYNLQGQRISSLQKGLNIVNGRKVYVK